MTGLTYVDGEYNLAAGTRDAFGRLSDELVREGHPPMVSLSGDREPEVQERLWNERMTLSPGNRKVYGYRWWNGRKWYQIHPDTVAPPGSGNHVARRSNDLKWPYNSDTIAARRAKVLARKYNITREGENFRELWHWTFWGDLGRIGKPSPSGGGATNPTPAPAPDHLMEAIRMSQIRYVHRDEPGFGPEWMIAGLEVPGGFQTTTDVTEAEGWGALYGTDKGDSWKALNRKQYIKLQQSVAKLHYKWVAMQKSLRS